MTIEKAMSIVKVDGLKVYRHDDSPALPSGLESAQRVVAYETDHVQVGRLWMKKYVLPEVGAGVSQHRHAFDHVTLVAKGRVRMICEDNDQTKSSDYDEGSAIVIRAGLAHHVLAITPGATIYCVHALHGEDE